MSVSNLADWRRAQPRARLREPADVVAALGIPFSDEQLAAICAPLEPGVIIAGAGSGKTTVMAARVVWLVGSGAVRPEQVLGLTFTRKAAAELSVRVRSALQTAGVLSDRGVDEAGEQVVMTYDAFAGRVVAEHGLRLGFDGDATLLTGATRFRLAARVVNRAAGPFEHLSRLRPASVAARVLDLDQALQANLADRGEVDRHATDFVAACQGAPRNRLGNPYASIKKAVAVAEERLELASLVADYAALKRELGMMEFADQMAVAARLAAEVPAVGASLREQFAVVLLDEYQDTSSAQAQLLQGLFSGEAGRGFPVTAVGDPFQAIYGWRGAAASNILAFATDFPRADATPATAYGLTINRRSGPRILDAANALAAPLREDASLGLGGRLVAPDGTPPGQVLVGRFETWPDEVGWIGDAIAGLRGVAAGAGGLARWADAAVLCRRNADIATVYAALGERDIPCEIVGLGGLLSLPEIADVVATLRLIDDVTANPDAVRLLTGPRWRIGPGDLALLGNRAQVLAHARDGREPGPGEDVVLAALEEAVADVDPTEVVCLLDAVEDPGELPYSAAARQRFAGFAAELAGLRAHAAEPVLDLTRRVIATLGLEVELAATPALARRDSRSQLGAFVDAVAAYVDVDGDGSLTGLLAYLAAEQEQGNGLDQASVGDADSVKLLTVHKAKGLEWDVVFVPALVDGTFPNDRVTDNWLTSAAALPAPLRGDAAAVPQVREASDAAFARYGSELKAESRRAEDRLIYVAATRARRTLIATGHWWRPGVIKPRRPSDFLEALWPAADGVVESAPAPAAGASNPLIVESVPRPWPAELDAEARGWRHEASRQVGEARRRHRELGRYADPGTEPLSLDDAATVAGWDVELAQLLGEARAVRREVTEIRLPSSLTATQVMVANKDPQGFAARLIRPMPRPPSRAARFGTRFHEWVERRFGQTMLPDVDELLDDADAGASAGVADEAGFRELCARFAAGRFGDRAPQAVEAAFTLPVGGALLRGRIDAVYAEPGGRWLVVDWKTSRAETADELQLAIYRLAWAELNQVAPERVEAGFYYVRSDRLVRPPALPGRAGIEAMIAGLGSPAGGPGYRGEGGAD